MSSAPGALGAALVVGAVAAFVAWGGGHDAASYGKAAAIGFVSAVIAARAVAAKGELAAAAAELEGARQALKGAGKPLAPLAAVDASSTALTLASYPELRELESSALARGRQPNASELLARRLGERFLAKIPNARGTAASAVYLGLAGTLIGLSFAVFGLKNLSDDADLLKAQILSVVAGFGGSFVCALCGILATIWLSGRIARHDAAVAILESDAEAYVAEVVMPSVDPERKMAELVAETVAKTVTHELATRLDGFWKPLVEATASFKTAADELRLQAKAIASAAEQSRTITAESAATSERLAQSSAELLEASKAMPDILRATNASTKLLNQGLDRLEPAFLASANLVNLTKNAEAVLEDVTRGVKGIAAAVREETKVAAGETTAEIARQQAEMRRVLEPPLLQIADALDMLRVVLVRTEEAARDLPIAVPATRIVADLRAAADAQQEAAARDASSVHAAADQLAGTEARINAAMVTLRTAHEELQRSLERLGGQTVEVKRHLDDVTERLDTPFWKRLAGRKR